MTSSATILLVEDSRTQAAKLAALCQERGFAVSCASDGVEGLEAARSIAPTIIISDIRMPGMDGLEMCRRIKEDSVLGTIPVILLTSLSDPQDVVKGLECGADGFIVKSGSDDVLFDGIARVLSTHAPGVPSHGRPGIRALIDGEEHRIVADPQHIFDFLISTYDTAYRSNAELSRVRDELSTSNELLESRVTQRTAELARKNQEISDMYQQLWHAARLATVGELTASFAHEINNPLQTVSLHVESLSRRFSGDAASIRELSIVGKEIDRIARLVRDMMQFSRKGEQRVSMVSLAAELDRTLELILYLLKKREIRVEKDFPVGVPLVKADPEQLQQTFLNLFTNACDAMPSGGTLTLRLRAGPPVVIEIADTGRGIAPADLPHVMEIFFTTKPPGSGTGLGLPICRRIVEAHGGSMFVESELGKGTTVRILLPAAGSEGHPHESE
jgi:signal transduction histidine kinase